MSNLETLKMMVAYNKNSLDYVNRVVDMFEKKLDQINSFDCEVNFKDYLIRLVSGDMVKHLNKDVLKPKELEYFKKAIYSIEQQKLCATHFFNPRPQFPQPVKGK